MTTHDPDPDERVEAAPRALDLRGEPSEPSSDAPRIVPYDPDRQRDWVRAWLAMLLLMLLIVIVVVALCHFWQKPDQLEALKTILQVLLTPVLTLLGTVLGFYFGAQTRPENRRR